VRFAFPELAPGYGSGLGWSHIVAVGRAVCNDGYWGALNLSIMSLIMAGTGDVGSLVSGHAL
jgi:hypothetical protein